MKLLNKTNVYFFGVSSIIFCVGGILFYFLFEIIIDNDITDKLHDRKEYTIKQIARSDSLILFQHYSANTVSIKPISSFSTDQATLSDTIIFDHIEGKSVHYRQLSFSTKINNRAYLIHVRRPTIEQKELIEGVVLLEIFLFVAFVVILTMVNNQVSKKIWQPFYFIVDKIGNYKVDLAQSMVLPETPIDEFNELSLAIEKMSIKINSEFNIQKEFTENASHEIQTPLAIIRNKLEILMQSPELSKEQMDLINSASMATTRLSKLNEALIILSKIENRQFHEVEVISINESIDRLLSGLDELIKIKSISISKDYKETVFAKMHTYLAEILLENLVINSIKHNTTPGTISITTEKGRLEIANTGASVSGGVEKFFQRFVKSNQKSQSLGLGLPIVKAICDTYLLNIDYKIERGYHKIAIHFQQF